MKQIELRSLPSVVPNYPLRALQRVSAARRAGGCFEVVYCGSVGLQQKLDMIARSVVDWPASALFRIVGNSGTATGRQVAAAASQAGVSDRVLFDGWTAYDEVPSRLVTCSLGISLLDPCFEQWRTALGASNKRYQYMQASLPQIGDMNPGVRELLEGQGIGRCIAAFEPGELARVVTEYADDPERCRREGERAYRLHIERYNYQRAFQPVLDWINDRLDCDRFHRQSGKRVVLS